MIRGILLAGGAATRFGSPKLLHPLPGGTSVGGQSAATLLAGVGNALAVVRPGDTELMRIFAEAGCEVLVSQRAHEGMGGSLATAIAATRDAAGWVIALADMPFLHVETVRAVRAALAEGTSIAVPANGSVTGHPVGFPAAYGPDLAALSGDAGARQLLARHAANIRKVMVDDANIRRDVDVPGDLPG